MAPPPQVSSHSGARATIPPHTPPEPAAENPSGKKRNRWSDTEEKIFIELFGENEGKLRYKSYTSPEWASIVRQLRERCQRENVFTDKNAIQCKNKMANLAKKYKNAKAKLCSTGYGRGGDEADHEMVDDVGELLPKDFRDLDELMGHRQGVDPRHVLGSSTPEVESGEIDRELLEKEALDDEILSAAERQTRTGPRKEDPTPGSSGECSAQASHDSSDDETFTTPGPAKSRKRTSTPQAKKEATKMSSKKARSSPETEESTVLSFLERAQERNEAFMERMVEAERQSRREQQKFSMDVLAMLGNILKDVAKGREWTSHFGASHIFYLLKFRRTTVSQDFHHQSTMGVR